MNFLDLMPARSRQRKTARTAKALLPKCAGQETRPHCRNRVAVRMSGPRKGKPKGALCNACRSAVWRRNSPYRAAYIRLKGHARQREIPFTISFGYFKRFAERSELIGHQGLTAEALTVDRWNNLKGYVYNNLKVMTRRANTEKLHKRDQIRYKCGYAWNGGYAPGEEPAE